ncbi:phage portal protein [Roseovarius sp. A46]|uniref:phage portal protein n=1 Tax=Roseovarius sp. A46 TaxID=2109331 RepID=UPI00101172CB|nr:phage portal protein [Roseovarius sp. A46]RXV64868.1 phage portal protein [Roseovarius sp. A46]
MWPFNKTKTVEVEQKSTLSDPESWLLEMFGSTPTQAGVSVSPVTALRVPAVSSAIRVISEAAMTLTPQIKTINPDGTETIDTSHPALPLLTTEANDYTTAPQLMRDLVIDGLTLDQGGLAWINRVNGRPVEIIHYTRGSITVEYDTLTREPSYRLQGRPLAASDVIHLRSPFSRSPLSLAREAIGLAIVMERHAARLFGRGAKPSGALSFPKGMGEEAVKKMRAAWRSTHEGEDPGGRTAILYDGAEFTPFQLTSTDAQFLENRKFAITEIARAFRVPPSMLFDMDRMTWSNTELLGKEFLTYTLEPWLVALEGALRQSLFEPEERPFTRVHFDRDDLTRADLTTRATAINSLIASRVLNPNEGRAWLDLPPRDGGEVFANPNTGGNQPERTGGADDGL